MNTNGSIKKFEKFHKKETGRLSYSWFQGTIITCAPPIFILVDELFMWKRKLKPVAGRLATNTKMKVVVRKTDSVMGRLADSVLKAPFISPSF